MPRALENGNSLFLKVKVQFVITSWHTSVFGILIVFVDNISSYDFVTVFKKHVHLKQIQCINGQYDPRK